MKKSPKIAEENQKKGNREKEKEVYTNTIHRR